MNFQLIIFVLFAVALGVSHGKHFKIADNGHTGECIVTKYTPGGSKVTIEKIKAPVAKMETDVITSLLAPLGKGVDIANYAMDMVKMAGKVAKFASVLGPAMSVFSAGMFVMDLVAKPTMADLLKEVNNAIDKLTNEVNDRLDSMKGYVDEKIITLEKELMSRDYKHMFQMFALCINEGNARAEQRCIRRADNFQSSAYKKFATVDMPKGRILDVLSVKKLEVNLLTFRDYVIMRILTMRTLIDTYKQVLTEEGQQYFQDYCHQIKTELAKHVDYVNKAYFQIKIGHTRPNICKKTVSCKPLSSIKEGWPAVHTADRAKCKCKFDEFMTECDQALTIRADGKNSYKDRDLRTNGDNKAAAVEITPILLASAEEIYTRGMGRLVQQYWTANLLDLLPAWKAIEDATYFVKQDVVIEVDQTEVRITALKKAVATLDGRISQIEADKKQPK